MTESTHIGRAKRRVGTVLREKWQLNTLLGVGGMAAVYSAVHRNGKQAALKILHPELCAQPHFVARFLREGYVANKIEHPASVAIIDDEVCEDGTVFLVMELLKGASLDNFTRRREHVLPLARILAIADDVLDLLTVAHPQGIVHRDLKPANIFLTTDDRVKVLDFGIARLAERTLDASSTQTGAVMGTPAYMPPEQARGRWNLVDERTDLWALGATTFALIAGETLRRAETVQEELLMAMTTPLPSLSSIAPQCPPELVAWVDRSVSYQIEARWPDAVTMQRALRAVVQAQPVAVARHTVPDLGAVANVPWGPGPRGPSSAVARLSSPSHSSHPSDPSHPSASPDTRMGPHPVDPAPAVTDGAERIDPFTNLNSGGTMGEPRPPSRAPIVGGVVAACVLTLALGVAWVQPRSRVSPPVGDRAVAATGQVAPTAAPETAPLALVPPVPMPTADIPAPGSLDPLVDRNPRGSLGDTSTSGAPDASTAKAPLASQTRKQDRSKGPVPTRSTASPPPAPANPLDQRF